MPPSAPASSSSSSSSSAAAAADGGVAADIQTEFQAAESLFAHMQQAAAAVISLSSDDCAGAATAADCRQLVDSSRAHAAACARPEQLATFLDDKVHPTAHHSRTSASCRRVIGAECFVFFLRLSVRNSSLMPPTPPPLPSPPLPSPPLPSHHITVSGMQTSSEAH